MRAALLCLLVACADETVPYVAPPDVPSCPDAPSCPALVNGVIRCADVLAAECHAPATETGFGLDCPLVSYRNAPCYCTSHLPGVSTWCMP